MAALTLKLLGGLCVCAACVLAGMKLARRETRRIDALNEFKKAFYILRSETDFAQTELSEVFTRISARTNYPSAEFFGQAAKRLKARDGTALTEIWERTLENFDARSLTTEDVSAFARLGGVLGGADKRLQISAAEMAIAYIDEKTAELRGISEKNSRMYRSLGVLGGLLIVVVMF